jgi:hypothetical protein
VVIGTVIECPLHQGRFDVRSGEALNAPVCVNLNTCSVKVEGGKFFHIPTFYSQKDTCFSGSPMYCYNDQPKLQSTHLLKSQLVRQAMPV